MGCLQFFTYIFKIFRMSRTILQGLTGHVWPAGLRLGTPVMYDHVLSYCGIWFSLVTYTIWIWNFDVIQIIFQKNTNIALFHSFAYTVYFSCNITRYFWYIRMLENSTSPVHLACLFLLLHHIQIWFSMKYEWFVKDNFVVHHNLYSWMSIRLFSRWTIENQISWYFVTIYSAT